MPDELCAEYDDGVKFMDTGDDDPRQPQSSADFNPPPVKPQGSLQRLFEFGGIGAIVLGGLFWYAHRSHESPSKLPPASQSCATHACIPNFYNGSGYIVQCRDGMWSHSGERPGACADHGGEL